MNPTHAIALPPALAAWLADKPYGLITTNSSDGTVLIAKLATRDIEDLRGTISIHVSHELYGTEHGPVLRLLLVVEITPPLRMECFCNVADPSQLSEWQDMLGRPTLRVLCYDEQLKHRLSKLITQPPRRETSELIPLALKAMLATPPEQLDFDRAKEIIQEMITL